MHRLFCLSADIAGGKITISDTALVHHVKDVLRVKPGEPMVVCDDKSNEYSCVLEAFKSKNMVLNIKDKRSVPRTAKLMIAAACAIPKNSRFDDIVDKLTQVGTDKIIPMLTERVIVKLDKHKESLRLNRWQKVASSAAGQSQRTSLPEISPIKSFPQVLEESARTGYDLKLIPSLAGERKTLKEVLGVHKPASVLFLIGPEGDFTPAEITLALAAGFIPVSLGELTLRVETAAVSVASFIRLNDENR
jgi:16S rRNA (uracil1498-N3)-methyltransferase